MNKDNDKNIDGYSQIFESLNIPVQPLPSNYSPEEYGRKLLSMSKTEHGVSYAASTDYFGTLQQHCLMKFVEQL